jgi:hypothetical protein
LWRDTLGSTTALAADGSGPTPGTPNGIVDQADYDFWKANFGDVTGAGSAGVDSGRVIVASVAERQPPALPGVDAGAGSLSVAVSSVETDGAEWIGAAAFANHALVRPPAEPGVGGLLIEHHGRAADSAALLSWVVTKPHADSDDAEFESFDSAKSTADGDDGAAIDCVFALLGQES